jgi:hypothetical protein
MKRVHLAVTPFILFGVIALARCGTDPAAQALGPDAATDGQALRDVRKVQDDNIYRPYDAGLPETEPGWYQSSPGAFVEPRHTA